MNINLEFYRATVQIARLSPAYVQAETETHEIRDSLPHRHLNIPVPPATEARLAELATICHELFMAARATLEAQLTPRFKDIARVEPETAKSVLDQAVHAVKERHS